MSDNVSCWSLIEQKKFEEACLKADEDYKITKFESHLANKGIALLNLKKYNEALELYLELIKINKGESESDFKLSGICFWLLGKQLEAVSIWKEGLNCLYTDGAGGVEIPGLLYYAAVSLQDKNLEKEAISLIKKKFKTKIHLNYPGFIVGYILEKINDEEFLNSYASFSSLRERILCKAYFYIAVKCLKNGNKIDFYKNLEKCVSNDTYIENEYYLAIGELDKREQA